MSVKIRLARHGRKQHAYYHIVVANSRAPRDGRFIERIGSYNPNTNPATIDLDFDKAISWLFKGAQPTDTTRSILSHEGVMMKKHLLEGAKKGAFSEAEAEVKFEAWMKQKAAKVQASKEKLTSTQLEEKKARLKAEAKVNEAVWQKLLNVMPLPLLQVVHLLRKKLLHLKLLKRTPKHKQHLIRFFGERFKAMVNNHRFFICYFCAC